MIWQLCRHTDSQKGVKPIEDRELFDKIKKGAVSQSNAREIKRLIKDTFSLVALKKICGETEI